VQVQFNHTKKFAKFDKCTRSTETSTSISTCTSRSLSFKVPKVSKFFPCQCIFFCKTSSIHSSFLSKFQFYFRHFRALDSMLYDILWKFVCEWINRIHLMKFFLTYFNWYYLFGSVIDVSVRCSKCYWYSY
jgi:hypothetical protein